MLSRQAAKRQAAYVLIGSVSGVGGGGGKEEGDFIGLCLY